MGTAHQARGVAAAHGGAGQAARDQLLRQLVRTLAAGVGGYPERVQEVAHRIAELDADASFQVADRLAVLVEAAAAGTHQHVGVGVHALGGVGARVRRAGQKFPNNSKNGRAAWKRQRRPCQAQFARLTARASWRRCERTWLRPSFLAR